MLQRIMVLGLSGVTAVAAFGADIILNEYNAVGDSAELEDGGADPFWGRRPGNGGDWFELVRRE